MTLLSRLSRKLSAGIAKLRAKGEVRLRVLRITRRRLRWALAFGLVVSGLLIVLSGRDGGAQPEYLSAESLKTASPTPKATLNSTPAPTPAPTPPPTPEPPAPPPSPPAPAPEPEPAAP